jgi:protoporphyrinogen oxidase
MSVENKNDIVCIGAGPAGLTAAYLLSKENIKVHIIESDPNYVGGLSRTVSYKGFSFDIGGHRFFSESSEVTQLWHEILGDNFLVRPRLSRIYYQRKFFSYPLKPFEALCKLGLLESVNCLASYIRVRLFPIKNIKTFEDWVSNQFGERLFRIFFKTYTEKVWGMKCNEISSDWASQRIKDLSVFSLIKKTLFPFSGKIIKTLIEQFHYPKMGPGMMWQECLKKIQDSGSTISMGVAAKKLHYNSEKKCWVINDSLECVHVINSAPLRQTIENITPTPPEHILKAAKNLKYRDFLTVCLIVDEKNLFEDNWIYIHDENVKVGRIQNYKNWSPHMVPNETQSGLGLEYFCFENDNLWNLDDGELAELAKRELVYLGLVKEEAIKDYYIIRQKKAYPVYDETYKENIALIKDFLDSNYPNLHMVGRNGMHKYNNQDHSMLTALATVKNIISNDKSLDPWKVNTDTQYHEQKSQENLRQTPRKVKTMSFDS